MRSAKTKTHLFFALLTVTGVLVFLIARPFAVALLMGAVFAVLCHPAYDWLCRKTERRTLAAVITVGALTVLIVLPLTFVGIRIFEETQNLYRSLSEGGALERGYEAVRNVIDRYLPGRALDPDRFGIERYADDLARFTITHIASIFGSIVRFAVHAVISAMAMYYVLKDGKALREFALRLSPLEEKDTKEIIARLIVSLNAVMRGSLIVGLIQGVLTGIGFAAVGITNAMFWGSIAAVAALVPGAGTALVTVPGVLVLLFRGEILLSGGLLLWAILGVGLVDNFLGPRLMRKGVGVHQFIVLISVLGGIGLFGPAGFFIGPLVVSFFFALLEMYGVRKAARA